MYDLSARLMCAVRGQYGMALIGCRSDERFENYLMFDYLLWFMNHES